MLTISKDADPNYLAEVIVCPELKDHPNADRLQILNVFGGDVIVAKGQYTQGEKLVFYPTESCISHKFLAWANLLDKADFNADGKTKGFFSTKGDGYSRVKAAKLRELPSQGFVYQVSKLAKYYNVDESVFKVGTSFDTVGEDRLAKKYVRNERGSGNQNTPKKRVPKWVEKTIGVFPQPVRKSLYKGINYFYNKKSEGISKLIVEGHWHYHYRTENFGKMIFTIDPEDDIVCSMKMHGTSGIYGNILYHKAFNIFRYLGNKVGLNIEDTEYKFCYSSRSVLKNRKDGKYTEDVWGVIASKLEGQIPPNIICYGELVGFSSHTKHIQKWYHYMVPQGEVEFRMYRITENTPDGVREFSWDEIEKFCEERNIKTVPVYYKGKAKDMFDIEYNPNFQATNWRQEFLKALKDKYLDKDCEYNSGQINEGIVIRNESKDNKPALKYKSPLFILGESAARDKGEEDMEEES